MKHDDTYAEKISMWLDGELPPGEAGQLQKHLAHCTACQHTYQAMQHVHALFRHASTSLTGPEPGFTGRFETRLARHTATERWRLWAGLSVLLLGTFFFAAAGAVVGGVALVSAGATLFDTTTLYYGLGLLGERVNEVRLVVNLAGLVVKVALLTMRQPVFWGVLAAAAGLAGLWVRLVRSVYRQKTVPVHILI